MSHNRDYEEQQTPLRSQLSSNFNEDADNMVQDIANNIRLSQDLFDSSTPAPEPKPSAQGNGSTKKKPKFRPHIGMTPKKSKPSRQNVSTTASSSMTNNSDITNDDEQTETNQ